MPSLLVIAGTRPEFLKLGAVVRETRALGIETHYVATGQHDRTDMVGNDVLDPTGDGTWPLPSFEWAEWDGRQTDPAAHYAELVPARFRDVGAVLVQGDTASALAGALFAGLHDLPLIHLEAGLRSWDPDQVEERIRVEIDRRADLLLAPSRLAAAFASRDTGARIEVVGQTGYDALDEAKPLPGPWPSHPWALLSLHRHELCQRPDELRRVFLALARGLLEFGLVPVVPLHPTPDRAAPDLRSLLTDAGALVVDPQPFRVMAGAWRDPALRLVATDSGGLVEESYYRRRLTIVVRPSTERWEAITDGWARLLPPYCIRDEWCPPVVWSRLLPEPPNAYAGPSPGASHAAARWIERLLPELSCV